MDPELQFFVEIMDFSKGEKELRPFDGDSKLLVFIDGLLFWNAFSFRRYNRIPEILSARTSEDHILRACFSVRDGFAR